MFFELLVHFLVVQVGSGAIESLTANASLELRMLLFCTLRLRLFSCLAVPLIAWSGATKCYNSTWVLVQIPYNTGSYIWVPIIIRGPI